MISSEKTVVNYVTRADFLESTCFFKVTGDERDEWLLGCVRNTEFNSTTLFALRSPTAAHARPSPHSTPNNLSQRLVSYSRLINREQPGT